MSDKIKNIVKSEIINLSKEISNEKGQIASKTLAQNDAVSITIFSFSKGEEISTHESNGDALVSILEGKAKIIIDNKEYLLSKDDSIIMPANHPHSLYAEEDFKMILTVVF